VLGVFAISRSDWFSFSSLLFVSLHPCLLRVFIFPFLHLCKPCCTLSWHGPLLRSRWSHAVHIGPDIPARLRFFLSLSPTILSSSFVVVGASLRSQGRVWPLGAVSLTFFLRVGGSSPFPFSPRSHTLLSLLLARLGAPRQGFFDSYSFPSVVCLRLRYSRSSPCFSVP